MAERGIEVDHVTVYRRVLTFTVEFFKAVRRLGTRSEIVRDGGDE